MVEERRLCGVVPVVLDVDVEGLVSDSVVRLPSSVGAVVVDNGAVLVVAAAAVGIVGEVVSVVRRTVSDAGSTASGRLLEPIRGGDSLVVVVVVESFGLDSRPDVVLGAMN